MRALRKTIYWLERQEGLIGKAMFGGALACYRLYDSLILRRQTRPDLVTEKLVLRDQHLVFLGVPKVATRSLIAALKELPSANSKAEFIELDVETLLKRYPEVRGYFKFCFVRNPWSRATSCYREKISSEFSGRHSQIKHARIFHARPGLYAGMSFEAFAEWLNTPEGSDEFADRHWMSQHRILGFDRPGLITYDFIGRFERLNEDYQMLGAKTGLTMAPLKHLLRTQSADQYKTLHTPRTRELIAQRYARDIELFGYDFDSARDTIPAGQASALGRGNLS